ncbi:MAG: phosphonate C-P lyase system protein PhnH [Pseudomonadota bacterium]
MLSTPTRSDEEIAANAAFDALLWALSRPGQVRELPAPGEGTLIAALLDRECAVFCEDPLLIPAIMQTGASICDIALADHVFLGKLSTTKKLQDVRLGSDLYPDDGATVVVRASIGSGPALRLTGPGVNGQLDVQIDGLPDDLWETRKQLLRYPMGFDLFIIDSARIIGLPRSTEIEVL